MTPGPARRRPTGGTSPTGPGSSSCPRRRPSRRRQQQHRWDSQQAVCRSRLRARSHSGSSGRHPCARGSRAAGPAQRGRPTSATPSRLQPLHTAPATLVPTFAGVAPLAQSPPALVEQRATWRAARRARAGSAPGAPRRRRSAQVAGAVWSGCSRDGVANMAACWVARRPLTRARVPARRPKCDGAAGGCDKPLAENPSGAAAPPAARPASRGERSAGGRRLAGRPAPAGGSPDCLHVRLLNGLEARHRLAVGRGLVRRLPDGARPSTGRG